ncbi:MAG: ComEC family competence protein [Burkholderiales bacterium]|nr:ComEC family competence protein [Bacteroidia bacterium]
MINFKSIPFLRILFPFVIGIVCALHFGLFANTHLVCAAAFVSVVTSYLFQKYYKPGFYFKKGFYIFSLYVFLFILAFEACFLYNARNDPNHYTHYAHPQNQLFIGTIDDIPVTNEKTTKLSLRLNSISDQSQWHYATGNVIAYFKNDSGRIPELGDHVLIDARLSYVSEPKNPGEFNYKTFLEDRNIFHTAYVQQNQFTIIPHIEDKFSVLKWGTQIKSYVVLTLRNSGLSQDAFAICSALLVGYDDEIDKGVMQSFSHSGTLHILSVSGMHTGVLYGILVFLFSVFDKHDRHKKLKCFFVLMFLFLFVGITGFSPSVLRAALMLSLVILGKTFYRQGNSYNTLLLSAFLLLLYNPYLIKDIGFLLSYLAVFGIMYFYPVLSGLYMFQNKILQWLWMSVLISVSATLFTLPISLYYFHQFPLWFVFSNLIIIPISMFIMFGAIVLLLFSKILLLKQFIAFIINFLTSIMLVVAKSTDNPGYGFIDFISFSKFDLLCCSFLIISFLFVLAHKQYKYVLTFCTVVIIWLSGSVLIRYKDFNRNELLVFHVKNKSIFALKNGQKVYSYFEELTDREFQRCVKPYLLQYSAQEILKTTANLFRHNKHTILNLQQTGQPWAEFDPDYIIVSNDAELNLTINHKTKPVIIVDCSNSFKFVKKLRIECLKLGIPFYSIKEQGALRLNI